MTKPVATKSAAHSDWCARWVTDSVKLETRPMLGRLYDATVPCSCSAEPVATLPAKSLNARCRRVWVCKRCGNCEAHCKHGDKSNFHEDLTMPCSVFVSAPEVGGEPSELEAEMERDAMIETMNVMEKETKELLQVARMSLQQFEFQYGKRKRGWDAAYLMERLRKVIADCECSGDETTAQPSPTPADEVNRRARAAAEESIKHLTPTRLDRAQLWLDGDFQLTAGKDVVDAIEEIIMSRFTTDVEQGENENSVR